MGRKKRRISATGEEEDDLPPPPPPPEVDLPSGTESTTNTTTKIAVKIEDEKEKEAVKSNYAMTSHSGDLVEEDIYVSDGSEDEDDEVDLVLSGSKMGLMRRGLHQPLLVQPNLRQWVKPDTTDGEIEGANDEEQRRKAEEELLASLDPAERAARLLAEKQRKLEEAKDSARRLESEENAGRDPCLFSKRTAFDIRFDQIDDKPWERNGDLTDFFNYGLTVEDWLEYAQQQLTIRQELTDASRLKRPPDPNIVPVTPRKPKVQTPRVAVASSLGDKDEDEEKVPAEDPDENLPVIGPEMVKKENGEGDDDSFPKATTLEETEFQDVYVGDGGAWGAGAAPDSTLARLIAEQTQKEDGGSAESQPAEPRPPVQVIHHHNDHHNDHQYMDNSSGNNAPNNPNHGGFRNDHMMHHGGGGGPLDNYDNRGNPGGYDDPRGNPGAHGYDDPRGNPSGYDDQSVSSYGGSSYAGGGNEWRHNRAPFQGGRFDDGGRGRFVGGRVRGRGRGRGRFGGRPPFPPGPPPPPWGGGRGGGRWGGRGDDYGGGGYGGGGYYQRN